MTLEIGVLFADLRGFTSDSESRTPAEVSIKLRRFYAHAEKVFFPEALIDKLIGDEVMALYVPPIMMPAASIDDDVGDVKAARTEFAREQLRKLRLLVEEVKESDCT
jgi:adenylate cyclase